MDKDYTAKVSAALVQDTTGKRLSDLDFHAKHCECGHRLIDHMVIKDGLDVGDGSCHRVTDEKGTVCPCTGTGFTEAAVAVVAAVDTVK